MAAYDLPGRKPPHLCNVDIRLLLQRNGEPTRQPGILRPADRRECQHRLRHASAGNACHGQRKDQSGERQKNVREPHPCLLDPAAIPSASCPDPRPDGSDEQDDHQRPRNAGAPSDKDTGKHIAPISIRSQKVHCRRRLLSHR